MIGRNNQYGALLDLASTGTGVTVVHRFNDSAGRHYEAVKATWA